LTTEGTRLNWIEDITDGWQLRAFDDIRRLSYGFGAVVSSTATVSALCGLLLAPHWYSRTIVQILAATGATMRSQIGVHESRAPHGAPDGRAPNRALFVVELYSDPFGNFHGDDGIFVGRPLRRPLPQQKTSETPKMNFGGYIGDLRRRGLDVVFVIDDSASMKATLDNVRAQATALMQAVHRLVPAAGIGIVIFGPEDQEVIVQPLTVSAKTLQSFLDNTKSPEVDGGKKGGLVKAITAAIAESGDNRHARRAIVLIGDSAPEREQFRPLLTILEKFRAENGTLGTVQAAAVGNHGAASETWQSFRLLGAVGGGSSVTLSDPADVGKEMLVMAFGEGWRSQVAAFGRGLTAVRPVPQSGP
jgi:hypothetical protein